MKKVTFALLATLFAIFACQKNSTVQDKAFEEPEPIAQTTERKCASEEVLQQQLAADPALRARMAAIEDFTSRQIATGRIVNGVMEIPVVVNVLYKTTAQNISDAQIQSQIAVLNEDFQKTNADAGNAPGVFANQGAAMNIRFVLDRIIRKKTNKTSWSTNDAMKKSAQGGIDATTPTTKLNMWACNLSQGVLGYAQFPGGAAATDGVVILYSAFGRTGTLVANYNKGRTGTHEVGHWLNLRHIWGDATCGNDFVADTPVAQSSNGGCPTYPKYGSCSTTMPMMTMNYMDYTYDACMYMFTAGQVSRMDAIFVVGGPRASFR